MASFYDYIVAPFTIINIIIGVPLIFISLLGINMVKEYNFQKSKGYLLKKSN